MFKYYKFSFVVRLYFSSSYLCTLRLKSFKSVIPNICYLLLISLLLQSYIFLFPVFSYSDITSNIVKLQHKPFMYIFHTSSNGIKYYILFPKSHLVILVNISLIFISSLSMLKYSPTTLCIHLLLTNPHFYWHLDLLFLLIL